MSSYVIFGLILLVGASGGVVVSIRSYLKQG